MRIKKSVDNGNLFGPRETSNKRFKNAWPTYTGENNLLEHRGHNSPFNSNCNAIYASAETTETFVNYEFPATSIEGLDSQVNVEITVCNQQFRINANNPCNDIFNVNNLEDHQAPKLAHRELSKEESDAFSDETPIDDDRVFDHSDTDEMSERGIHLVPRGIVNPNYPGFQHLAHTLQDYSSNIENFYHSENDMTDDDADVEITELTYEPDDITIEFQNNNNNNVDNEISMDDIYYKSTTLDSFNQNDMPDLIQTLSKQTNNNGVDLCNYEINCTDADIENNFNTKDIIGNFNKEVEEEIKQLLNYNINIQDDLEELRKDIQDTLGKPIENTINNISDVVNHVIKKLVETQSDTIDESVDSKTLDTDNNTYSTEKEEIAINKENEKNTQKEMHLSRPTFLNIDKDTKIDDAFLSDGKEEIDVSKYEADKLSLNVENTIKQLSTELRKIIPKLDEMRRRDQFWAAPRKEAIPITTDGNSNEINSPSSYDFVSVNTRPEASGNLRHSNSHIAQAIVRNLPVNSQIVPREARDHQKDVVSSKTRYHNAHSNTSVLKNDSGKDNDLGSFDVYNIETALPKLDIDTIENHLRAAKEAERRSLLKS